MTRVPGTSGGSILKFSVERNNRPAEKVVLISEALSLPFDEGIKNAAYAIYTHLRSDARLLAVTNVGNETGNLDIIRLSLNRVFLSLPLRKLLRDFSPDIILYLPEASATFNSFLRARVLKYMYSPAQVMMLSTQSRTYTVLQDFLIRSVLSPDMLFVQNRTDAALFSGKGIDTRLLPPAVDSRRFSPPGTDEKDRIRKQYGISATSKVVLHIGHIKAGRNIEWLREIQSIDNCQVVIVGSTSTKKEDRVKQRLEEAGVMVIDRYIEDISTMYKMSDIYVFPVTSSLNAIDMPLSVLEAMACNLPVITTRFGGLVDVFHEDSGFRYVDSSEELKEAVIAMNGCDVKNVGKVGQFTWKRLVEEIIGERENW